MVIPPSSVAAAMGYLYGQLVSTINDSAVLVSYGPPGPNLPDDVVMLGLVERTMVPYQMVGSGGAGWIDETYTIEITVSVYRGGDNGQAVFERASVLTDLVEAVVRTDPSLGGAVTVAHPAQSRHDPHWDEAHKGLLVDVTLAVVCQARI